eukprot:5978971-Amphidinium_carterae.1
MALLCKAGELVATCCGGTVLAAVEEPETKDGCGTVFSYFPACSWECGVLLTEEPTPYMGWEHAYQPVWLVARVS